MGGKRWLRRGFIYIYLLIFLFIPNVLAGCGQESIGGTGMELEQVEFRVVRDMRDQDVKIPQEIQRVATISDGLIESTMLAFGVQDKIVGLGSNVGGIASQEYVTYKGEHFSYVDGMNPAAVLFPKLKELPVFCQSDSGVNFETLASLEPDVVLIRLGDCTLRSEKDENTMQTIARIESMNLPVVALRGPNCFEKPTIDIMYDEIKLLGEVFDHGDKAREISDVLNNIVQYIKGRTKDIKEQEKTKLLFLGLNKGARDKGGAASVMGSDDVLSDILERYVNAKNAFQGSSQSNIMSAEQILSLNPDVILLPSSSGYHPARELYEGEAFRNLQELDAIKNRRVFALANTMRNCCIRFEHMINLMVAAKASYPERFTDFTVHEWTLDFYKKIYGVDDEMAKKMLSAQFLDWMIEEDF